MSSTGRSTRKRQRTGDHIARVAAALFERHGYEAVTMEQIATEADVARGTLYNHFPVKEAVLAHWMHAELAGSLEPLLVEALSRGSFVSGLATVLEASAQWWEEHRQYAAPYIRHRFQEVREGDGEHPSSDMIAVYARLIARAQHEGELTPDAPPMRLALYLHFLYLCAVMTWLGDGEITLADEFARVLEFFVRGASPGRAG